MLMKLILIEESQGGFADALPGPINSSPIKKIKISPIYVNPAHVVALKEDIEFIGHNLKKRLPEDIPKDQKFTRVLINRGSIAEEFTVIGSIEGIAIKLNGE